VRREHRGDPHGDLVGDDLVVVLHLAEAFLQTDEARIERWAGRAGREVLLDGISALGRELVVEIGGDPAACVLAAHRLGQAGDWLGVVVGKGAHEHHPPPAQASCERSQWMWLLRNLDRNLGLLAILRITGEVLRALRASVS
jgi:hypothetical protein